MAPKPTEKVKLFVLELHPQVSDLNHISKLTAPPTVPIYMLWLHQEHVCSAGGIKDSWSGQALVMRANSSLSLKKAQDTRSI